MTDTTPDVREALRLAKRELRNCMHNARKGHVCFDGDDFHEALAAVNNALAASSSAAPVAPYLWWIDSKQHWHTDGEAQRPDYVPQEALPLYTHPQPAAHSEAPEIRNNDDGTLDEVVGTGPFHLEQMTDSHWWLGLQQGTTFVHVNLYARGKIKASVESEQHAEPQRSGEALRSDEQKTPEGANRDLSAGQSLDRGSCIEQSTRAANGGSVDAGAPVSAAPALQEREAFEAYRNETLDWRGEPIPRWQTWGLLERNSVKDAFFAAWRAACASLKGKA